MAEDGQFPVYPGWETVKKLGSGSFGAVYEIRRDLFGVVERAALKQIRIPQDEGDVEELFSTGYDETGITEHYRSYLAEIVREYQLMLEMKGHTNVVYCDDIRFEENKSGIGWNIFIKMELLNPLMKNLDKVSSEEQVRKLGLDMASALNLCRARNIIHRDIKPQNIFISKDGDFKLGDFGIAKTVEKTSGGTKIGTYNYMAPEVYNNLPYGHPADIYSLGLVLYWLLNDRRLPFYPKPPQMPSAGDMENARTRRFRGEPLPAPAHGSAAFRAVVLKACAFNPVDRYQTADELLRDLKKLEQPAETESFSVPRPEEISDGGDPIPGTRGTETAPREESTAGAPGAWSAPAPQSWDGTTVGPSLAWHEPVSAPAAVTPAEPVPETAAPASAPAPAADSEAEGTVGKTSDPRPAAEFHAEDATVGAFRKEPAEPAEPAKPAEPAEPEEPPKSAETAKPAGKKKKIALILGAVAVLALVCVLLFRPRPFGLSLHDRQVIGDAPRMANELRLAGNTPPGTVPYCFGMARMQAEKVLENLGGCEFYTMRYHLRCEPADNSYVLKTDPPAGEKADGRILVELTQSRVPDVAVCFQPFCNEDGSIQKGIFLDAEGKPVEFRYYSYTKLPLPSGHTLMEEKDYDKDGNLIDIWTYEFVGEGYLLRSSDKKDPWMKQIHYTADKQQIGVFIWDNGKWTEG